MMSLTHLRSRAPVAEYLAALATLVVIGCGSEPTPPRAGCDDVTIPPGLTRGTSQVNITGSQARAFNGGAGGYTANAGLASLAVLDAFATDAEGRPTAELFILFPNEPEAGRRYQLAPVSAAQFNDPAWTPSEPFAVYGEAYDPVVRDYTRWFTNATGCLRIVDVISTAGEQRAAVAQVELNGTWERGATGSGSLTALLNAPFVSLYGAGAQRDTLFATMDTVPARAGAPIDSIATNRLSVFQTLKSNDTRLVVGASARVAGTTGDTTELWLVLPGVTRAGQLVALGAPTLDEAKAGRAAVPFGMVRFNGPGSPPVVQRIFRSTGGTVNIRELVLVGPAALCGWVRGDFDFDATGTDVATGGDLGTRRVAGTFKSTLTVLQPADSVRDSATMASAAAVPLPPATAEQCTF
jgi:hypothetical protein